MTEDRERAEIERRFHRWWKDGEQHPGCSENWGAKTAYMAGYKSGAKAARREERTRWSDKLHAVAETTPARDLHIIRELLAALETL